jgi:hypothetical protein
MPETYEAALSEFVRNGGTTPARIGWQPPGEIYHEAQVYYEDILRVRPLVKSDA